MLLPEMNRSLFPPKPLLSKLARERTAARFKPLISVNTRAAILAVLAGMHRPCRPAIADPPWRGGQRCLLIAAEQIEGAHGGLLISPLHDLDVLEADRCKLRHHHIRVARHD